MEKMQTDQRIITTVPGHGHQNRLIYALTMLLIAKIIIFWLLGIRQGVTGSVGNDTSATYTLPVSYSGFFVPVTGFGRDVSWGPIYSALTVCKNGLTSITLKAHEGCSVYVITIGT